MKARNFYLFRDTKVKFTYLEQEMKYSQRPWVSFGLRDFVFSSMNYLTVFGDFFALFCSCCARSWFSSPGGSSCSECFFLFKEDCSTRILERATTNESFISAMSWVSCNSGDDESTANPRFRRQPNTGLGGGAHGNGDSLNTGVVCRNLAIPWCLL